MISSGRQTVVQPGDNLQRAIDAAKPGDTLTLIAGAVYNGPFTLPNKPAGTEYITIQTSNLEGIAPPDSRIKPQEHAAAMPKILSPNAESALKTAPGAHHYRFVGIEFAPQPNSNYIYNLIDLGSDSYKSLSQFPQHLIFDRCYIHSTGLGKVRRGFALNCGETSILNSYISGFAGAGDETQGIAGWNSAGPFHIINNRIEGGGQNLFFGGGDPQVVDLVPSDVEVRRNYLVKPPEWKGKVAIKAIVEMKNVRRLVMDGNLLEDFHSTTAFTLTVRNQNGTAPWSTIEDVTISNNIIKSAYMAINILGRDNDHPGKQARGIRITNNLFVDIGTDNSAFVQTTEADGVTVEHNTVQHTGNVISSYGRPTTNFIFRDNILQNNAYGIFCESGPLPTCLPGAVITKNVIADNYDSAGKGYPLDRSYPPGNWFPRTLQDIGFVSLANADFRLTPTSRFRKRGTDGKDPGVNFEELNASGAPTAAE
jgi:parallel beta helix pectate lyase-like protein